MSFVSFSATPGSSGTPVSTIQVKFNKNKQSYIRNRTPEEIQEQSLAFGKRVTNDKNYKNRVCDRIKRLKTSVDTCMANANGNVGNCQNEVYQFNKGLTLLRQANIKDVCGGYEEIVLPVNTGSNIKPNFYTMESRKEPVTVMKPAGASILKPNSNMGQPSKKKANHSCKDLIELKKFYKKIKCLKAANGNKTKCDSIAEKFNNELILLRQMNIKTACSKYDVLPLYQSTSSGSTLQKK